MKTRAGLFRAVGEPLEVVEIDLAEPGPHDVIVRHAAVGICGTDLHEVRGEFQQTIPMVLGHEARAWWSTFGDAVDSVQVGDEVVLSWAPSCGHCGDCARGRPAACTPLHQAIGAGTLVDGTTGMSLEAGRCHRGTATGAWAERVVVTSKVALPTGGAVPFRDAALLGCAALTGVGSVLFAARARPGGSRARGRRRRVGQFVVQGARIAGSEAIVAVDPVEARREQALRLGATHAVHPDDLEELMASVAPEGADYGFDAVGFPATTVTALAEFTRSGGTAVIVGIPPTGMATRPRPGAVPASREVPYGDDVRL